MRLFPIFFLLLSAVLWTMPTPSHAEEAEYEVSSRIYEPITMENLSQLYWGINRLDIENDTYIDHFLMINECDIYKDYVFHEFEWTNVREAGREYIKNNANEFPLRFEFVQQINLGSYDMETEEFEIIEEHQINGIRRFYVDAIDGNGPVCGEVNVIEGYPRGIVVEVSRPLDLQSLPLEREKAEKFITQKLEIFKKLQGQMQSKSNLFAMRNVYLVLKIKIFANQGDYIAPDTSRTKALVLGVLEAVEVYTDEERTDLLYSIQYRKRKNKQAAKEEPVGQISPNTTPGKAAEAEAVE